MERKNHDNRAKFKVGTNVVHASGLVGVVTGHHVSGSVLRPSPTDANQVIPVWVGEEELGADEDYSEDQLSYCVKSDFDGTEHWATEDSLRELSDKGVAHGSTG